MIRKRFAWPSRDTRGFTLIEIIMIILIIGVLSALAMKAFVESRRSSCDTQALNFMRNLLTAAETEALKGGLPQLYAGEQRLTEYPQLQLNDGLKLKIQDSGDTENKIQFYLAHEGGRLGFYFWIPGPQCTVDQDSGTTDADGNRVPSDVIVPNMENKNRYTFGVFRTNAGF